jgi:hypothetical protein
MSGSHNPADHIRECFSKFPENEHGNPDIQPLQSIQQGKGVSASHLTDGGIPVPCGLQPVLNIG